MRRNRPFPRNFLTALLFSGGTFFSLGHGVAVASEELKFAAQVDKAQVHTGEPLTFSVTISGPITRSPKVELTSFEGFQVVSTGQSQQIQAGRGTPRMALTLFYTLAPTTVGSHTLGPVKVEYKGQTFQTQPIEVKVVPGSQEEQSPRLEGGVIL